MNEELKVEAGVAGIRTVVIRAHGSLDARGTPVLMRRCAEVRTQGRHLALNLSGVTFISSSGVGALLALVEEFRSANGKVRLAEVSPAVLSVVKLLNLDSFLSLCPTEPEAVAQLEATPLAGEPRAA